MADRFREDLLSRTSVRDYPDDNGKFSPNYPPVPTSGGREDVIVGEALDVPGISTTDRRAIASNELDKCLAEYDTRREQASIPSRLRRSYDGPGPIYERKDAASASIGMALRLRPYLEFLRHLRTCYKAFQPEGRWRSTIP